MAPPARVEDEPSLIELNSEVLRELGYEVLAAATGAQALAMRPRVKAGSICC